MNTEIIIMIFWLVALFASITVHEYMHAWSANYLGDPTAKAMGRVSLNPIAHIDLFGTIILPLILVLSNAGFVFGYAKPVQINPNNFKDYRKGQALTALAGPVANLGLVFIFTALYKLLPDAGLFSLFLLIMVYLNLVLMVFNLIPVPPLDGSKILYMFLPFEVIRKLEQYGAFLLIFVFLFAGRYVFSIVNFIATFLDVPLI